MYASRLTTALGGLVIGLVVSIAAWVYFDTFLFFLFLPFVPLLVPGRDRTTADADGRRLRRCPSCDFETRNPEYEYCPRDGARLTNA